MSGCKINLCLDLVLEDLLLSLNIFFYVIKMIFFQKMKIVASQKRSFCAFSGDFAFTKKFYANI